MACDRCGTVRWFPMSAVGTPHCYRGAFGFILTPARTRRPRPSGPCPECRRSNGPHYRGPCEH